MKPETETKQKNLQLNRTNENVKDFRLLKTKSMVRMKMKSEQEEKKKVK